MTLLGCDALHFGQRFTKETGVANADRLPTAIAGGSECRSGLGRHGDVLHGGLLLDQPHPILRKARGVLQGTRPESIQVGVLAELLLHDRSVLNEHRVADGTELIAMVRREDSADGTDAREQAAKGTEEIHALNITSGK